MMYYSLLAGHLRAAQLTARLRDLVSRQEFFRESAQWQAAGAPGVRRCCSLRGAGGPKWAFCHALTGGMPLNVINSPLESLEFIVVGFGPF